MKLSALLAGLEYTLTGPDTGIFARRNRRALQR